MEITTRSQAIAAGDLYYFTGKPCKRGHLSKRYVGNGGCYDCLHPVSTSIVLSRPAEIILPETMEITNPRLELSKQRLELEKRKLELKAQIVQFRAVEAQNKLEIQRDRAERIERRQRADTVKNKLTTVIIVSDPLDYASNFLMIWAFAAQRNPLLKQEDLKGREFGDSRYQFKCFPEDKQAILDATNDVWNRRQASTLLPEIEQKRLAAQAALQAMVDAEDNGEPEGDPT